MGIAGAKKTNRTGTSKQITCVSFVAYLNTYAPSLIVCPFRVGGIFFVLLFLFTGCLKESPIKEEKAQILQLAYVPSTHSIGTGVSGGGHVVVTSNTTDEIWAVVFRCKEHNMTFALSGKHIYEKASIDAIVTLRYIELSNSRGEIVDYKTKEVVFK